MIRMNVGVVEVHQKKENDLPVVCYGNCSYYRFQFSSINVIYIILRNFPNLRAGSRRNSLNLGYTIRLKLKFCFRNKHCVCLNSVQYRASGVPMGGLVDSSATGTLIWVSVGLGGRVGVPLLSQVGPTETPVLTWGQNPKYFRFWVGRAAGHPPQSHHRFM